MSQSATNFLSRLEEEYQGVIGEREMEATLSAVFWSAENIAQHTTDENRAEMEEQYRQIMAIYEFLTTCDTAENYNYIKDIQEQLIINGCLDRTVVQIAIRIDRIENFIQDALDDTNINPRTRPQLESCWLNLEKAIEVYGVKSGIIRELGRIEQDLRRIERENIIGRGLERAGGRADI